MERQPKQVTVTINGRACRVEENLTILEAARQNGIRIPTLCHHPALSSWGGCRLCVVEVDGSPKLVASCVAPVRDGMSVITENDAILQARKTILTFLFAERNHYCMFCAQSGSCELQDLAYELQMDHLTVPQSFTPYPVDVTSDAMTVDHNRCILCGRCVRACHEIAGAYVLNFQERGMENRIVFDQDAPRGESSCLGCGVCLQVCPTGAIYNRYRAHQAVKGHRKENWQEAETFCARCGLMCRIQTVVNGNQLIRVDGIVQPGASGADRGQLCAEGRFAPLKSPGRRILHPMLRKRGGGWEKISWRSAMDLLDQMMSVAKEGTFGLASGRCANESLMIFRDLMQKGWHVEHLDTLDGLPLRTIDAAWKEIGKTFLAVKEAHWQRILDADHILIAGVESFDTQPLIGGIVRRQILEKKVPVTILGPADAAAPWTSLHLPVAPEKLPDLVKAMLAEMLNVIRWPVRKPGWESILEEMKKISGVDLLGQVVGETRPPVFSRIVETFAASRNPMLIAGRQLTGAPDCQGLRDLMLLSLIKGILPENTLRLVILKPNGNSAGALRLGLASANGKTGAANWRRGLMLLEDDDAALVSLAETMRDVEFLAVISPYFPEALSERAQLLIPKPAALEEEGSYTSLDGHETRNHTPILARPREVGESWQTLLALIQRTEFHPSYARWKDISARTMQEMIP